MRLFQSLSLVATLASAIALTPAWRAAPVLEAQVVEERVDLGVFARIRDEGMNHSRIDSLAHHLTDVIGPRLTGSTGMKRANDWTAEQFRAWGLSNVAVEPWGQFGRGWERVRFSARVVTPYVQSLQGIPSGWTGRDSQSEYSPVSRRVPGRARGDSPGVPG